MPRLIPVIALFVVVLAAACSDSSDGDALSSETTAAVVSGTTTTTASTTDTSVATTTSPDDTVTLVCTQRLPDEVYVADVSALPDPATDLDVNLPAGSSYFAWSTRDGPESDFAPCFHRADDSPFDDDSLVIGIELDGEARAYIPDQLIAHVVNDRMGPTPLLVSY